MILRLSDSLGRGLVIVFAVLLGLGLSFFSIRSAVATYEAESNTDQGLKLAARLEPGNPE
jgi:hypothetical protein